MHVSINTRTYTYRYNYIHARTSLVCQQSKSHWMRISIYTRIYTYIHDYGVPTISRLLKMIGLFYKRDLQKRRYSAKETYHYKEPTNRSHHIQTYAYRFSFPTEQTALNQGTLIHWTKGFCKSAQKDLHIRQTRCENICDSYIFL